MEPSDAELAEILDAVRGAKCDVCGHEIAGHVGDFDIGMICRVEGCACTTLLDE